jgi:hypothetical protein
LPEVPPLQDGEARHATGGEDGSPAGQAFRDTLRGGDAGEQKIEMETDNRRKDGVEMIEMGKTYRLANGWEYRLCMTDGGGTWPVLGFFKDGNGQWTDISHTANGKCGLDNGEFDLIEVKPKRKLTVYINVYKKNAFAFHETKDGADARRAADCIAFVTREIEYEEGEGL